MVCPFPTSGGRRASGQSEARVNAHAAEQRDEADEGRFGEGATVVTGSRHGVAGFESPGRSARPSQLIASVRWTNLRHREGTTLPPGNGNPSRQPPTADAPCEIFRQLSRQNRQLMRKSNNSPVHTAHQRLRAEHRLALQRGGWRVTCRPWELEIVMRSDRRRGRAPRSSARRVALSGPLVEPRVRIPTSRIRHSAV
jgi:hypothetical protein